MGGQGEQPAPRSAEAAVRRVGAAFSGAAVSMAPFGVPVVPDVDTTTATSSSISSSIRNDVVSKRI